MLKGEARPPKSPLKGMKYVVVSGGVLSGLGKGVTASSIGVLLKSAGLRVTAVKIDPYLNSDAGTMSPFEHGEVFVLDDGGEADLDLGIKLRFSLHLKFLLLLQVQVQPQAEAPRAVVRRRHTCCQRWTTSFIVRGFRM